MLNKTGPRTGTRMKKEGDISSTHPPPPTPARPVGKDKKIRKETRRETPAAYRGPPETERDRHQLVW